VLDNYTIKQSAPLPEGQNPKILKLRKAAADGESEAVANLLKDKELNINGVNDKNGYTAFTYAVMNGHLESVGLLLADERTILSTADKANGWSALAHAVRRNQVDILRAIVDDEKRRFASGSTLKLRKEGEPRKTLHPRINPQVLRDRDHRHMTPLLYAAGTGKVEMVRALLDLPMSMDLPDQHGWTALTHAVVTNRIEVVRLLLDDSRTKLIKDKLGRTVLMHAASTGPEMVKVLLEYVESRSLAIKNKIYDKVEKDKKDAPKNGSLISEEVYADYVEGIVKENVLAPIFGTDDSNETVLHYAARLKNAGAPVVAELLNARRGDKRLIDPSARSGFGKTALQLAIEHFDGNTKLLELLLNDKEIDVNLKDGDGNTALHNAVLKEQIEIVRLLLARDDIHINLSNGSKKRPLDIALDMGLNDIAGVLFDISRRASRFPGRTDGSAATSRLSSKSSNGIQIPGRARVIH